MNDRNQAREGTVARKEWKTPRLTGLEERGTEGTKRVIDPIETDMYQYDPGGPEYSASPS